MNTGDHPVSKWAFLALLLIFLLFGEAPFWSDKETETTSSASPTEDYHPQPETSPVYVNFQNLLKQNDHEYNP